MQAVRQLRRRRCDEPEKRHSGSDMSELELELGMWQKNVSELDTWVMSDLEPSMCWRSCGRWDKTIAHQY